MSSIDLIRLLQQQNRSLQVIVESYQKELEDLKLFSSQEIDLNIERITELEKSLSQVLDEKESLKQV
jgi:hypothetical protein